MTSPHLSPAVRNEQLKLTATFVNAVASASVVAGVIAPLAAAGYGIGSGPIGPRALIIGMVVWLSIGGALHWGARAFLRRLQL